MQGRLTTFKSGFCFDVYSYTHDIYRHKKKKKKDKMPTNIHKIEKKVQTK